MLLDEKELWSWCAVLFMGSPCALRATSSCGDLVTLLWRLRNLACPDGGLATQKWVPEGPEAKSAFQILDLDLHLCLIKGFFEFPKFRAEDLIHKVLTLKRFQVRHPKSAHCQSKPSVTCFKTTWLPDSMASRQHGCLGKFTVNYNPASVLKELSEQNYNKDYLMLTNFTLEKVFWRKQFLFNYHCYWGIICQGLFSFRPLLILDLFNI